MKMEFQEEYELLFENSFTRLNRTLKIKLEAIKYC